MFSSIYEAISSVPSILSECINIVRIHMKSPTIRGTQEPKMLETCIGFDSEKLIEPGKTMKVISRPQAPFRGNRLVIPNGSSNLTINDLRVGNNSQFVSAQSLPASVFSQPHGIALKLETAQISQDISLVVTNDGDEPIRFRGALFGTALV